MCRGTIDLARAGQDFGAPSGWHLRHDAALRQFAEDGLVTWRDATVTVPPRGAPVIRVIAATFDTYLVPNPKQHALAV